MDNLLQIEEIRKYDEELSETVGASIPLEVAAQVWVMKYAAIWRLKHPGRIAECGIRISE